MCMHLYRLPGLESSKNNRTEEDAMYDEMMGTLLRIVLRPVLPLPPGAAPDCGMWDTVREEPLINEAGEIGRGDAAGQGWRNLLKWKAFTRANREKILAEYD